MEPTSALITTLGIVLLVLSWLLLLVYSANEDFAWALCTLLLPPLSYLYGFWRWDTARDPIVMAVMGWLLIGLGVATG